MTETEADPFFSLRLEQLDGNKQADELKEGIGGGLGGLKKQL